MSLGLVRLQLADVDAGIAELRRACELAPQVAAFWNNLGKALLDNHRVEDAIAPLRRALELDPGLRPARFSLAYTLGVLGDVDAAARQYRALIAQRDDDAEAWIGLAQMKRNLLDDHDLAYMQRQLRRDDLHPADRNAFEFACAEALQQRGDHAAAFEAWQRANTGVRARHPWDREAFGRGVDKILAGAWPPPVDAPHTRRAIFIVGLPRSGTSIVEQILDCHAEVVGVGESTALGEVLFEAAAARRGAAPADTFAALDELRALDAAEWRALGERYLERAGRGLPASAWLADKLPGNWLYVGAALAMLPGARVIVCRRDPVEAGFSCYRQRFAADHQAFSYDLDDIGGYWRDFDRACRGWRARYPAAVMNLDIEALSREPEPAIRALLDFCGLPFDAACLHPEANPRAVRTLSATQVRRPIQPVAPRAPAYGALLDPLRAALGSHLDAWRGDA